MPFAFITSTQSFLWGMPPAPSASTSTAAASWTTRRCLRAGRLFVSKRDTYSWAQAVPNAKQETAPAPSAIPVSTDIGLARLCRP
eukprot:CAMPEP_0179290020 /NCGR_PEP_ID=MMETSP0797-20121207/41603_1 /TAXON_ID=47934 /ORGANISM="Dinophysis acuminata, Strain DAEP01" /LENGTH=84 /DNA_ID=CAMNT_0020999045 /DNA_START=18 /DNA_END=269 /DNA_ORIENTATION=-